MIGGECEDKEGGVEGKKPERASRVALSCWRLGEIDSVLEGHREAVRGGKESAWMRIMRIVVDNEGTRPHDIIPPRVLTIYPRLLDHSARG